MTGKFPITTAIQSLKASQKMKIMMIAKMKHLIAAASLLLVAGLLLAARAARPPPAPVWSNDFSSYNGTKPEYRNKETHGTAWAAQSHEEAENLLVEFASEKGVDLDALEGLMGLAADMPGSNKQKDTIATKVWRSSCWEW
jgi:hypothetical protein